MGVLQIAAGAMRLGKFIRMVPHPVMLGFVNGLAIVIFLAQLGQFGNAGEAGGWLAPLWKAASWMWPGWRVSSYTCCWGWAADDGDHPLPAPSHHGYTVFAGGHCRG